LYMSPEQAELNNLDVDTRTDIYALGVILYELLTGTTPLEKQRLQQAAWQEMVRLIKEEEPPRPSARLSGRGALPGVAGQGERGAARGGGGRSRGAGGGGGGWGGWWRRPGKHPPPRRYESANSFAGDVQHFLAGEPVQAAPPSVGYRLRKFVRKHRAAVLTGAAFVALLVIGTITSLAFALQAGRHAERAPKARKDADDNAAGQALARRDADRNAAAATAERDRVRRLLFVATMNLASTAHAEQRSARLRELLAEARPAPGEEDKRGFEWHYL